MIVSIIFPFWRWTSFYKLYWLKSAYQRGFNVSKNIFSMSVKYLSTFTIYGALSSQIITSCALRLRFKQDGKVGRVLSFFLWLLWTRSISHFCLFIIASVTLFDIKSGREFVFSFIILCLLNSRIGLLHNIIIILAFTLQNNDF